jgi:hypothetical protein
MQRGRRESGETGASFGSSGTGRVGLKKGVVHRTRAPQRVVVLMIEAAGVAPTGD